MKNPFNLYLADLNNMRKGKAVYITLFIALFITFIFVVFKTFLPELLGDMAIPEDASTLLDSVLSAMLFSSLFDGSNLTLMGLIAGLIVITGDFSAKTIRNKIIAGNSRTKIYLTALAINITIYAVFFIVILGTCIALSLAFFNLNALGTAVYYILLTIPSSIAVISIATFIAYSTKSRALSIVINLVIINILPTITVLANTFVTQLGVEFLLADILMLNPYSMITNILAPLLYLGENLIPTVTLTDTFMIQLFLIPLGFIIVSTLGGILKFNKSDIK